MILGMAASTFTFVHVQVLNVLAPSQTEAPFLLTQLVVLTLFVVLAIVGAIRFRDGSVLTA